MIIQFTLTTSLALLHPHTHMQNAGLGYTSWLRHVGDLKTSRFSQSGDTIGILVPLVYRYIINKFSFTSLTIILENSLYILLTSSTNILMSYCQYQQSINILTQGHMLQTLCRYICCFCLFVVCLFVFFFVVRSATKEANLHLHVQGKWASSTLLSIEYSWLLSVH